MNLSLANVRFIWVILPELRENFKKALDQLILIFKRKRVKDNAEVNVIFLLPNFRQHLLINFLAKIKEFV